MRRQVVERWMAFDRTPFDTAEACRAYETTNAVAFVAKATEIEIAAAVAYQDPDLAAALENVGERCRIARLQNGGSRRKRATQAEAPALEQREGENHDGA